MEHGFKAEHFALLKTWAGAARETGDPAQDAARDAVIDAYEATARWARAVNARLFPNGFVRKRSDPFDQGQTFKAYTWSRIYPRAGAPKGLAYTVGIDAVGEFCVKLDTVDLGGSPERLRYEELRRYDNDLSPFAAILSADAGLAMSFEALVDWSVERIGGFDPGYDDLARAIGLIPRELRLVTDTGVSRAAIARWRDILSDESGGVRAIDRHQVWFAAHEGDGGANVKLGLDPRGREWGVEINAPPIPGDHNRLSAIAEDATGGLHLLRQGWLRGRRPAPDIREEDFKALTGLSPEPVSATGRATRRQWFRVANLDDPPERIRGTTARFVELCWAARTPIGAQDADRPDGPDDGAAVAGGSERGGDYVLPARPATDAKIIELRHGLVWESLATTLGNGNIGYRKWTRSPGYEIDIEIDAPGPAPLLVEIKTACATSDVHAGVGQLMLYRQLFANLRRHQAVLLIDVDLPPQLHAAVFALGVAVHRYSWENADQRQVVFAPVFLALCGIGHA